MSSNDWKESIFEITVSLLGALVARFLMLKEVTKLFKVNLSKVSLNKSLQDVQKILIH